MLKKFGFSYLSFFFVQTLSKMISFFRLLMMVGWGPYAYFRALEESRSVLVPPSNGISMQGMNNQWSEINSNAVDPNLDSSFDAMESGRR